MVKKKRVNGIVNVTNPKPRKRRQRNKQKRERREEFDWQEQRRLLDDEESFMPASYVSKTRSKMRTAKAENGLRVSGYDLVYKLTPDDTLIDGAFVAIPANPAYWKGTRIAQLATAYSQYRPIYLRFDYFPVVGTSTNGAVTSGTFWNQSVNEDSLTQALVTSNGGISHPCYTKNRSVIQLKTNLEQNLFNMDGNVKSDTNPFIFLAATTGVNGIVPGYYMANYVYELKNPIGDGNEYDTFVTTAGQLQESDIWEHTSAVVMSETNVGMGPGTVLAIELVSTLALQTIQFFLKGSQAGVLANTVIKIFRNRNKAKVGDNSDPSAFTYQYIEAMEVQSPANNGQPTMTLYVKPVGSVDNQPFINVNSDQFSDDYSTDFSTGAIYGYVFKNVESQGSQYVEVYYVNTTAGDTRLSGTSYLSTIGYELTTARTYQARSISKQVWTQPLILHLLQQTPNGQQREEIQLGPVLGQTFIKVATLPECKLQPMTAAPETQIVVGRGKLIGRTDPLRVNKFLKEVNRNYRLEAMKRRSEDIDAQSKLLH